MIGVLFHENGNDGGTLYLLLLIPFLGLLAIPFYNRIEPVLFGFPFFYWYQFMWVPITALLTYAVYRKDKADGK